MRKKHQACSPCPVLPSPGHLPAARARSRILGAVTRPHSDSSCGAALPVLLWSRLSRWQVGGFCTVRVTAANVSFNSTFHLSWTKNLFALWQSHCGRGAYAHQVKPGHLQFALP